MSSRLLLVDKEALKKLPRLGMTLDQLTALWGKPNPTASIVDIYDYKLGKEGRDFIFSWENIGKVNLKAFVQRVYDEDGQDVFPSAFPCEAIEFSYYS